MIALADKKLDPIDHRILEILQKNARTRLNEMAQQLGLTIPTISERIQKLEDRGFIKGYTAILDAKRLGKDITAFITVSIDSSKHYQMFMERARETEEILECHSVTGEGSHLLKVRAENTNSLEKLLSRIQSWPGVLSTKTSVVLSTIKESTILKTQNN
ncbi:MAG TPA: Lrp/AsnC family transcriptional regulator [Candidatus Acidoferrales bacterium]|nr:Lrp/AsnC family transcriptional regulator [Candidatus Acidoferrales bacterium]